jgi:UPF0755 protein
MLNRRLRASKRHGFTKKLMFLTILGLILFTGYAYLRYDFLINSPVDADNTEEIAFIIKKGASTSEVAANLKEKNLIMDEISFKIYAKLSGSDTKILSGRYKLDKTMSSKQIIEQLTDPSIRQIQITIPEGYTVPQIDDKLTELALINGGEFKKAVENFQAYDNYSFLDKKKLQGRPFPLEGYLFPDTYFVNQNDYNNEWFISTMLRTFENRMTDTDMTKTDRNFDDIVNVASMIEKEANKDKDRPIIAGIIWKRIDEKWVLGVDATLLYLKNDREIDYKDLAEDSPYNTRKNPGLPPGPICNPGIESIKAAANPAESEYYYYLTSKDGEMIYSVSLDEHNRNKQKHL